jgi:GNAT superfamily N-acetyltransferase
MPAIRHVIRQYKLEPGALEVQYIEDYFQEFRQRKTADEIIRRLTGREHLILLSMAPIPDDEGEDDRLIPVAFKVGHALSLHETDPVLMPLVSELSEWIDFRNRKIFYSWIGGTRGPWRGQGHYRALTEQQEEWAHRNGYLEVTVKTKNKFFGMRAALAQLHFNVVGFKRNPVDIEESKVYMSKNIGPDTLLKHQTQRSVVEAI